jgi:hypothetical protein
VGIGIVAALGALIGVSIGLRGGGHDPTSPVVNGSLAAATAAIAPDAPAATDPAATNPAAADPAAAAAAAPAAPPPAPGDCTLIVPANPLTARGLATPYQLTAAAGGTCHEANPDQAAFVQATIIDPATGKLSVYNPLVIDAGTQPAAPAVVPTLPKNAIVGVWFGYNGNNLTLQKTGGKVIVRRGHRHIRLRDSQGSLVAGKCVNGTQNSVFGQFAYCNAPAFFQAENRAIARHQLAIPAVGTANDGKPCPTTRDFGVVDQDQSDNVTATYLLTADGRTAQATDANAKAVANAQVLTNASDNGLLVNFIDKAIGCSPFTAPDLANNGTPTSALALDELQATLQASPVALVPPNDPMTLIGDQMSRAKTNLYRAGSGMPPINGSLAAAAKTYCTNMITLGSRRIQLDQAAFTAFASPNPGAATNLFTFLGTRLADSYTNLNCQALTGVANPITIQTNGDVATGVTFGGQAAAAPAATTGTAAATTTTSTAAASAAPAAGTTSAAATAPAAAGAAPAATTATPAATSAAPAAGAPAGVNPVRHRRR